MARTVRGGDVRENVDICLYQGPGDVRVPPGPSLTHLGLRVSDIGGIGQGEVSGLLGRCWGEWVAQCGSCAKELPLLRM